MRGREGREIAEKRKGTVPALELRGSEECLLEKAIQVVPCH